MSWNEYRRQSQRLESKFNLKISEYEQTSSQLTKAMNSSSNSPQFSSLNAAKEKDKEVQRIINDSENILRDLQNLLNELQTLKSKIIDDLSKVDNDNNDSSMNVTSLEYTRQKCESLNRDFVKQLRPIENRLRNNIKRYKFLKGANGRRRNANDNGRSATDSLLNERESIQNTLQLVDQTIEACGDARIEIRDNQGAMANAIDSGLGILQNKFPQANELIFKIKKYRNRDSIVLACVCAVCLLFMFIYWLNK